MQNTNPKGIPLTLEGFTSDLLSAIPCADTTLNAVTERRRICRCSAYAYPHRWGSGSCLKETKMIETLKLQTLLRGRNTAIYTSDNMFLEIDVPSIGGKVGIDYADANLPLELVVTVEIK